MKKTLISVFTLALFLFQPSSFAAQTSDEPGSSFIADEVVAIVGNAPIMLSEVEKMKDMIIEQRKQMGVPSANTPMEDAFQAMLLQKVLIQKGRADSLDKEINRTSIALQVEEQVAQMIEHIGSAKELEKLYGKALFQIKRDLEREQLDQQISQQMQAIIKEDVEVSYNDVYEFFANISRDSLPMVPEQYVYAQITRAPEQTDLRKMAIRERLLGFRERILKGEKLAVLARLYSQDEGSRGKGGEIGPQSINDFVPEFVETLSILKPGQISEVVETEYGFHIIELISKRGELVHYRHLLLKPEFGTDELEGVVAELDSIRTAIQEDKITFAQAALRESHDKMSRNNGGKVFNMRAYNQTGDISKASTLFMADELSQTSVEDYRTLSTMKVGDISKPFQGVDESGNVVYKIITLEKVIPSHIASTEIDYEIIEEVALLTKESEAIDIWMQEVIQDMYVYISPEYHNLNLGNIGWIEASNRNTKDPIENQLPENFWVEAMKHYEN